MLHALPMVLSEQSAISTALQPSIQALKSSDTSLNSLPFDKLSKGRGGQYHRPGFHQILTGILPAFWHHICTMTLIFGSARVALSMAEAHLHGCLDAIPSRSPTRTPPCQSQCPCARAFGRLRGSACSSRRSRFISSTLLGVNARPLVGRHIHRQSRGPAVRTECIKPASPPPALPHAVNPLKDSPHIKAQHAGEWVCVQNWYSSVLKIRAAQIDPARSTTIALLIVLTERGAPP